MYFIKTNTSICVYVFNEKSCTSNTFIINEHHGQFVSQVKKRCFQNMIGYDARLLVWYMFKDKEFILISINWEHDGVWN